MEGSQADMEVGKKKRTIEKRCSSDKEKDILLHRQMSEKNKERKKEETAREAKHLLPF